jgi:hypothetical protein
MHRIPHGLGPVRLRQARISQHAPDHIQQSAIEALDMAILLMSVRRREVRSTPNLQK